MFPVDEADGRRKVDGRRVLRVEVSAALQDFAGDGRHVGDLGELGEHDVGAADGVSGLVYEFQDVVDYRQETMRRQVS